jgi:hypothetical protein
MLPDDLLNVVTDFVVFDQLPMRLFFVLPVVPGL